VRPSTAKGQPAARARSFWEGWEAFRASVLDLVWRTGLDTCPFVVRRHSKKLDEAWKSLCESLVLNSDDLNSFFARASAAGSAFPEVTAPADVVRPFTDLRALLLSPSHFAYRDDAARLVRRVDRVLEAVRALRDTQGPLCELEQSLAVRERGLSAAEAPPHGARAGRPGVDDRRAGVREGERELARIRPSPASVTVWNGRCPPVQARAERRRGAHKCDAENRRAAAATRNRPRRASSASRCSTRNLATAKATARLFEEEPCVGGDVLGQQKAPVRLPARPKIAARTSRA
jgi:hypothetical protein